MTFLSKINEIENWCAHKKCVVSVSIGCKQSFCSHCAGKQNPNLQFNEVEQKYYLNGQCVSVGPGILPRKYQIANGLKEKGEEILNAINDQCIP